MSEAPEDLREVAALIKKGYPACSNVCSAAAEYIEELEQRLHDVLGELDREQERNRDE